MLCWVGAVGRNSGLIAAGAIMLCWVGTGHFRLGRLIAAESVMGRMMGAEALFRGGVGHGGEQRRRKAKAHKYTKELFHIHLSKPPLVLWKYVFHTILISLW